MLVSGRVLVGCFKNPCKSSDKLPTNQLVKAGVAWDKIGIKHQPGIKLGTTGMFQKNLVNSGMHYQPTNQPTNQLVNAGFLKHQQYYQNNRTLKLTARPETGWFEDDRFLNFWGPAYFRGLLLLVLGSVPKRDHQNVHQHDGLGQVLDHPAVERNPLLPLLHLWFTYPGSTKTMVGETKSMAFFCVVNQD